MMYEITGVVVIEATVIVDETVVPEAVATPYNSDTAILAATAGVPVIAVELVVTHVHVFPALSLAYWDAVPVAAGADGLLLPQPDISNTTVDMMIAKNNIPIRFITFLLIDLITYTTPVNLELSAKYFEIQS